MSYVGTPFSHDLFVSYSHGDVDGSGISQLKSWSKVLADELNSELRFNPKFGAVKVFLDEHHRPDQGLDPMAPLTDQLREVIGGAALLAILMSERYLNSRWCREERDWWFQKQAELGLTPEEHVAVLRITPTAAEWPRGLVDQNGEQLIGFPFYDRSADELVARPFGWGGGVSADKQFREALLKVTGAVLRKLDALKQRMDERRDSQEKRARLASNTDPVVVYLHGRTEQAAVWEKVGGVLTTGGFTVLPGEPDRVEADLLKRRESRERRVEALTACDALLLLGTANGPALDADLVVVGRQDRHSARALANRLLPCGLLDTVGETIATPQRKIAAKALQVDWIDMKRELGTDQVRRWLAQKSVTAEQAS